MCEGPGFPGGEGGPAMVPPAPLPPRSMDIQPLCEHSIVFDVFCLLFFFLLTQATFGISRLTGDPIRDPQVTTVPLPVRNIGGSVSTHRQKGKNRQATLTGSYFRSVGAPKRQPLFRECDCEPDCEVMGSRSFLAWVWTCISIQPSSVGPV